MKGIFIGYTDSTKIFQVYIPEKHRVIRSGDVLFPNAPVSEGASNPQSLPPTSAPTSGSGLLGPLPSRPIPITEFKAFPEFRTQQNWRNFVGGLKGGDAYGGEARVLEASGPSYAGHRT